MKRGGEQQSTQGFTIVETMIVFAVTGILFALAVALVSGRQNKTDFQVGSRLIVQDIQRVINETQTGYYPNNANFSCSPTGGAPNNVRITNGSTSLGSNSGCVFGGKVMVFSSANPKEYSVYSLAGRRLNSSGEEVKTAAEAWLTTIPNSTVTETISNGLEYAGAIYSTAPSAKYPTGVVAAFLSGFDQSSAGTNIQTTVLHRLSTNWPSGMNSGAGASFINTVVPFPSVPASTKLQLCFKSGGTNQSVRVDIGAALDVSSEIKNGTTCGGII